MSALVSSRCVRFASVGVASISKIGAYNWGVNASAVVRIASIGSTSVVIVTGAARLAVSLANSAPIIDGACKIEIGKERHVRSDSVSLAVEHIEGVVLIDDEIEVGSLVQKESGGESGVNSSEIDSKLVIDKYPNIIISSEVELFVSLISESQMDLHAEMIVVARCAVSSE